MLEAADDALYAAKAAGRDTYRVAEVRPDLPTREIPVLACAVSPPDGLPRAGQPVQVSPGAGRARPVRPGVGVPESSLAGPAHARPDPADDTPDSATGAARAGPDAARPGPGGGASSGPHPPRQSRGR